MKSRIWVTLFIGISIAMLPPAIRAQGDQPKQAEGAKANPAAPPAEPHFYRLDFVVKEVEEGKVFNSRTFFTSVETDGPGQTIRSGTKVAIPLGSSSEAPMQYVDVGVNMDCTRVREVGGKLALNVTATVSRLRDEPQGAAAPVPNIGEYKWSASVLLAPGRPTTIFSSDDVTSKRKVQVELTATRLQ